MNRTEKILCKIDRTKPGIEIGPSFSPVAPKAEGYNVHIIDHLDREGLVARYSKQNTQKIEDVDFVWGGESYLELTNKPKYYSWIIASHVIEHTPDLIGFLLDCDSILQDQGVISLAIPDKRFCFDHFRPHTGIARLIDAHVSGNKMHSEGSICEYFLDTALKGSRINWTQGYEGEYSLCHNNARAAITNREKMLNGFFIDLHAWCFTPTSFRLIVRDLYDLGYIELKECAFFPTPPDRAEFYISLSKAGRGFEMPRIEALKKITEEVAV